MISTILAIVLGVTAVATSITSAVVASENNKQQIESTKAYNQTQLDMQNEINAQNEALTREAWARDDNAVQRRKADLLAAGLSPTLAAGSAASNSSPIAMTKSADQLPLPTSLQGMAPLIQQLGNDTMGASQSALDMYFAQQQNQRANDLNAANVASINQQTMQDQALFGGRLEQVLKANKLTDQQIAKIKQSLSIESYDWDFAKNLGVPFGGLHDTVSSSSGYSFSGGAFGAHGSGSSSGSESGPAWQMLKKDNSVNSAVQDIVENALKNVKDPRQVGKEKERDYWIKKKEDAIKRRQSQMRD